MSKKRKIAIIGANAQQTPLILNAKERGLETHVFAWQTGFDPGELAADFFYPISAGSKEQILEECQKIGISAIASIGSDISALTAAYIAEQLGLFSNTYASVMCATNKLLTRELFFRCAIPQPRYCAVGDVLPQDVAELGFPLVVKPSDRSGGRGLSRVDSEAQLMRAIASARDASFERRAIVEEYIDGALYSCECISYNGRHEILGYTRRYARAIAGKICEYRHEAPAILPTSVKARLSALAPRILDTLGLRCGASSIEFILSGGELYVIEVTPTMYGDYIGTDLLPLSTGYDYLGAVIDIALGEEPKLSPIGEIKHAEVSFVYSADDLVGAPSGVCKDVPSTPDGTRYAHYIKADPLKEFGGCPPLALGEGRGHPFENLPRLELNSEFTALHVALSEIRPEKLYLPHYISGSVIRVAEQLGVSVCYYSIDASLVPIGLDGADGTVLIINHNARCESYIKDFVKSHGSVIIDNSYSFFSPPILLSGIYNIYSLRRFFPVPDGAYLVSDRLPDVALPRDVSYKRARNLLKSLELGEGEAYKENMAAEQELTKERLGMSRLTEIMAGAIDYSAAKEARRRNFEALHSRLGKFNLHSLDTEEDAVRKFYPLLVNEDIRASLVQNKIYVPLMWRRLTDERFEGSTEKRLSERMLYLPTDEWYSAQDMEYIAEIILSLLS